ncbi:mitogen-activated protein kinase kinase kinase 17-like [Coffea eugenioides]|uniref:mitogen-activated protein kinase kinase kinase 17-like n=1 Tax=Coffea eugenioides TaxID=49369 RepID=UPI000F613B6C|nr:mitogen-activated protein kinase kinase kinase 17-like [Coffea eugenioides]
MTSIFTATTLKWKKYKKLGAGSYGTVYLAGEANSLFLGGSFAAVKSAEFEHSKETIKEAEFLKEVADNPYIVRCFGEDISIEKGKEVYNMLMEYAPGGTLHDLIVAYNVKGSTMPESHAAVYSYMLLGGLSHVHRRGLVHCDLKPCHILVFPKINGTDLHHLKIADFGLAKHVWEDHPVEFLRRHRGTQVYASPESIMFRMHGTATDVWSLGCTILEMMTGRQTWTDEEMWDLYVEMVQGPSSVISKLGKDFLRRFFLTDPNCRWTAPMLLDHPFITQNMKGLPPVEETQFQNNPFGIYDGWIVIEHLFSTPSQPQSYPSFLSQPSPPKENSSYQLFPIQCNTQAVGGPFSIPCGIESVNRLLA